MDFSKALTHLKDGVRVQRAGWNGKDMWIAIADTNEYEINVWNSLKYTLYPMIFMKTADDKLVPWLASQTDILAEDWHIVYSV